MANYFIYKRMIGVLLIIAHSTVVFVYTAPTEDIVPTEKIETIQNSNEPEEATVSVAPPVALPTENCNNANNKNEKKKQKKDVIYDQRQNGTENYRINIDGVLFAVAAPESLLSAVAALDLASLGGEDFASISDGNLSSVISGSGTSSKPGNSNAPDAVVGGVNSEVLIQTEENDVDKPVSPSEDIIKEKEPPVVDVDNADVGTSSKPKRKGLKVRLSNLILPFLRRANL